MPGAVLEGRDTLGPRQQIWIINQSRWELLFWVKTWHQKSGDQKSHGDNWEKQPSLDSVTIGSLLVYIKAPSPALAKATFPSSFPPEKKKKKKEKLWPWRCWR